MSSIGWLIFWGLLHCFSGHTLWSENSAGWVNIWSQLFILRECLALNECVNVTICVWQVNCLAYYHSSCCKLASGLYLAQNCRSWLWLVGLISVFDDMEESLRWGAIHMACLWESTCRVGGWLLAVVGPLPTSPCQSVSLTMITHGWVWVGFEMVGVLYESIFEQLCWQVVGWSTLSD